MSEITTAWEGRVSDGVLPAIQDEIKKLSGRHGRIVWVDTDTEKVERLVIFEGQISDGDQNVAEALKQVMGRRGRILWIDTN